MRVCLTLDLEPDHAGRAAPRYDGWQPERVRELLALLERHGAPLTVFVVGEAIRAQPQTLALFRDAGAELQLHSFSHDLARPDSLDEIRRGKEAFARHFGAPPIGYRAPEGRITAEGWRHLEAEGFLYDSSIFPSFWPHPRYLRYRPRPFRPEGTRLLELPISTLSPARLICSLSWFKLLGWPVYRPLLERGVPDPLVFDMHLHDLWRLPAFDALPQPWRAIYSRNQHDGMRLLAAFLALMQARGAVFTTLGRLATAAKAAA
jgi:peptidoglycan/xylan/chitin deacetylase (PgdA/CDA1 family)